MNKQQLATKIWESANKMRSKIEASEYKDYILGFIFYKFLSEREENFLKRDGYEEEDLNTVTEDDQDVVDYLQTRIGYFISYDNLFSTWLKMGSDFDVSNVTDALSAFSRLISDNYKRVFDGIFQTLESGISKLGSSSKEQSKAVRDLIYLINNIPMDGQQDYDVLGFIYEYLISNFAANAGKKAGEFYTPHEVSLLMSEIIAEHLKDRKEIKIYDPCSGSGSLLINIGKSVSKYMDGQNNIKYYAQELKQNTYNLTRMNLVMRGILPDNIKVRNGDTLEEDWPDFEDSDPVGTYEPLYVDAVTSNPPYSQNWDPSDKENDPRYSDYGLAPKGKADYAFLLHDLYHIKSDGIMTIVLPHGVLFRGGEEGDIRRNLIEKNKIDAIIGLPSNIFFGTGIPTIIMVLKQKRDNTDVLIIDASKGFVKEGKNNKLRACDIKRITDTIKSSTTIDKFSRVVSRDEIRSNDYNLNIPRYVDSSEKSESWDIYASMFGGIPNSEINELKEIWKVFPSLKNQLFKAMNEQYSSFNTNNLKETVNNNLEVKEFINKYNQSLSGFDTTLKEMLIDNANNLNIAQTSTIISDELFNRLNPLALIDPYEAYQDFDNQWIEISTDLEMIQTEGFDCTKMVDPKMVIKKKNNKEDEVQDGLLGHIIPFDLVQETYLKEDKQSLLSKKNRVSEIESSIEEILESLTEDEKQSDYYDEEKNKFDDKLVKSALKNSDLESETKNKLKTYQVLVNEKKILNKEIKKENESLEINSKETIENLSDDEVNNMLVKKWIDPLMDLLQKIPMNIINELIKTLESLSKKYEVTFEDIENDINQTEKELISMIDDLVGNEYDMLGLQELKSLLGGNTNE
ncbi:type I restriction-modification system subunit M [Holdemanella biformis]|uniref:type I restriction-modification system subunit M n=1 Tax=Holdemanella biformis TaxID=1735 RepID=UPI00242E64A0|nr:type I restriction-modification system subunit M [Holdemanella biformis]MBS6454209.1 type I restriction-modification system subunit M [Holdemanella biformis]